MKAKVGEHGRQRRRRDPLRQLRRPGGEKECGPAPDQQRIGARISLLVDADLPSTTVITRVAATARSRVGDETRAMAPEHDEEQRPERIEVLSRPRATTLGRARPSGRSRGWQRRRWRRARAGDRDRVERRVRVPRRRRAAARFAARAACRSFPAPRRRARSSEISSEVMRKPESTKKSVDAEIAADENFLVRGSA